ncbi:MAG TPA: hypothetical protein PL091_02515 [Actinomycetota bacterium]|nr:hypothetical protein [Actinomycetota bacterium]HRV65095.1 hypothetical protein [Candidatus Nanopelagicales bacterium]
MDSSQETQYLRAMSWGFGVGSALFAVGAIMAMLELDAVVIGVVFVLGALGFTIAAGVQWRTAMIRRSRARLRDPDYMAAAVQFFGTLFFNVMTIRALALALGSTTRTYEDVWHPDVFGSALFLIASWIAWHPIARSQRHHLLHGRSRLICLSNMLGSIFFGLSAVGARMLPDGTLDNNTWNNGGTLLGALCFLVGALALRPTTSERQAQGQHV